MGDLLVDAWKRSPGFITGRPFLDYLARTSYLLLAELVKAGATLVGPKPVRAHGLTQRSQRDAQVRQTADELWGPCDGRSVFEHRKARD